MLKLEQNLIGKIDAVAFGGEGILRYEGIVVFVPFAAIGDEVRVRITQVKKSFARAVLIEVLKPSSARITPRCVHFGVCGGCQLQHLDDSTQLELKQEWVVQSLSRIGKVADVEVKTIIAADRRWNYRRTVKLRFDETLKLSYVNATSDALMPVETCPIFIEGPELWSDLNAFIKQCFTCTTAQRGLVTFSKAASNKLVALIEVEVELRALPTLPDCLQGCLIKTAQGEHLIGDINLSLSQHGLIFNYSPLSFVQNHPEQSEKLSSELIELVVATGAKSVFDLYCGFGVSAIALAKAGINVTAVEGNAEAINLARKNASLNRANVEWVCDDVARFITPALRRSKPDAIIVNPPRTGLATKVVDALIKSKVSTIAYVSCMPQTLARDLALLCAGGYKVALCQPYDMFPQTTHVETLVLLTK